MNVAEIQRDVADGFHELLGLCRFKENETGHWGQPVSEQVNLANSIPGLPFVTLLSYATNEGSYYVTCNSC